MWNKIPKGWWREWNSRHTGKFVRQKEIEARESQEKYLLELLLGEEPSARNSPIEEGIVAFVFMKTALPSVQRFSPWPNRIPRKPSHFLDTDALPIDRPTLSPRATSFALTPYPALYRFARSTRRYSSKRVGEEETRDTREELSSH